MPLCAQRDIVGRAQRLGQVCLEEARLFERRTCPSRVGRKSGRRTVTLVVSGTKASTIKMFVLVVSNSMPQVCHKKISS